MIRGPSYFYILFLPEFLSLIISGSFRLQLALAGEMPVVTAGSKSLPLLHGYICEHQWYCSGLAVSVIIVAAILAVVSVPYQIKKRHLPKTPSCVSPAGQHVTWTPRASCSTIESNISSVLEYWVQLKQGQGRFEKRANRAVSRGEACGTALVGLGGSREGGNMEEEERVSAKSRSRGVSKNWSDGAELSSGSPSPNKLLVAAEQSSHVGIRAGNAAKDLHEDKKDIGQARSGGFVGVSSGSGSGVIQDARGRLPTSFGEHMADDEHILYGARDLISHATPDSGKWSHSPWPLTPPASAASTTEEGHSKSIAIPSRIATGSRSMGIIGGEGSRQSDGALYRSDDGISPSSYPPTSPLLPPAPPTAHEAFDPAAVMFPGPARDGGIRVVPPHTHGSEGAGPSSVQVARSHEGPGASWTRHTRVYGGGVCLACAAAAAAGEGGFYGDSVRPEDRR